MTILVAVFVDFCLKGEKVKVAALLGIGIDWCHVLHPQTCSHICA
jgi:hypothetical protein